MQTKITLLNSFGAKMHLCKNVKTSLFELIEESTDRLMCTLTKEATIEFIKGNITVFDSFNLPFNYKMIEEEMLTNTQNILNFINE